ncbi:MAG: long-chain fatty acid--CoA ligase, partial [Halioglobus sp.]
DRPGTSGRVLPHVEVRERDGEIEVVGNTFLGYMDQPATWGAPSVATGDLGSIDDEGYVTIAGRCKNLLITSFGRNVSPEWVESELLCSALFQQVIVVGDDRPACAALLHPLSRDTSDRQIQTAIDKANTGLPDYAQVRHWCRLPEPLAIDNGLLTENGRPRRRQIQNHYQQMIDQLYNEQTESMML